MFALTTKNDGLFDLFFDRPLDVRPSYQRTKVQTKVVSESDRFKIQIAAVGVPKELVDIQVVGDVLEQTLEDDPSSMEEIALIDAMSRTKAQAVVAKLSD